MVHFDTDPLLGKRMLVGIGAQKSGTSWLQKQISRDARVCMPIKELHHFDAFNRSSLFGHWPDVVIERVRALASRPAIEIDLPHLNELALRVDHAKLMRDRDYYLEFFRHRILPRHTLFGEITPSYATLGEDGFRAIKNSHDDVRIIFLMRDPVERLISGVRHEKRLTGGTATWEDILLGVDDATHMARCRYDITLRNLDNVFQRKHVLTGFFENMFNAEFCGQVGEFLGLDDLFFDISERVASDPDRSVTSKFQRSELRKRLSEVYEYCADHFGPDLPSEWML